MLAPGGKRILVSGALVGEEVAFQRQRKRRNYDEGTLLEIRRPSPDRVVPACEYFGRCGGCSLQHLSADGQLAMKQGTLLDSLGRIAGLEPGAVLAPLRGRSGVTGAKARLAVRFVAPKGRVLVGFRERDKPFVVDMAHCATLEPRISGLLMPLSTLIGTLSVRGRLPQVEVVVADNATALVFRVLDPLTAEDRQALLTFGLEEEVRLYLQSGGRTRWCLWCRSSPGTTSTTPCPLSS